MSQRRRHYDEEFKKNAVKLSYATSKTIEALCEDLGIHSTVLYRWRRKYTSDGQQTPAAAEQEKLRKLQIENAELKIECEMLKKAAAYFAKNLK
jgi:transposase